MGLLDDILGSPLFSSGNVASAMPPDMTQGAPSSGYLPPQQDAPGIPGGLQYLMGGQAQPRPQSMDSPQYLSPNGQRGPEPSLESFYDAVPTGLTAPRVAREGVSPLADVEDAPRAAREGMSPPVPTGLAGAIMGQGGTSANALDPYAPQQDSAPPTDVSSRGRPPISVPLGPQQSDMPQQGGGLMSAFTGAPQPQGGDMSDRLEAMLNTAQQRQNDPLRRAVSSIGAGLSKVGSSPFAGQAFANAAGASIEGGDAYDKEQMAEQTKLLDTAIRARAEGNTRAYREATIALRQSQQAQAARQNDIKAMQPVKMGTDSNGREIYGVRDPKSGTLRVVDPATGKLLAPGQKPQPAPITDTGASASADDAIPQNAQMVSGEGQTRNEDFLKTLAQTDPQRAALVKKLADYDVDPRALSVKGGHREGLLGDVARYDPDYSMPNYPARAAAIKEFTAGGSTSPAAQITAGNTAIQHAGDMSDAAEEMKKVGAGGLLTKARNAGIPFVSYAAAQLQNKSVQGTPEGVALAKFLTDRNHFSEEVTKFYAGSGGSEAERKRALDNLDAAKSVDELRGAIAEEAKLMGGKVNALQDRWKNAVGGVGGLQAALKRANVPDYPIIQQKSAEALKKVTTRAAGQDYQPPEAGPQPARAAPAPTSAPTATPKSKAEFDALPSGAPFIAPDGSTRIKP